MNSNEPLVSIITPLFNAEKYISETIESVICQTYKNWEMIIVDDCSTDKSCDIVKSYQQKDMRIRLIESDINFGGPARPRNIGLRNARGAYVAFLDADDVWLSAKLARQVCFMLANPDVDICHTLANIIDSHGVVQGYYKNQKTSNLLKYLVSDKNILFYSNNININSVIMKIDREIFFEEDRNIVALEDRKYWIDNLHKGKKIHLLKKILLNYRIRQDSISNRSSDEGYRKATYLLSKILLEKNITLIQFFLAVTTFLLRIKLRSRKVI